MQKGPLSSGPLIVKGSAAAAAASALLLFLFHRLSAANYLTIGALAVFLDFKLYSALTAYENVSCFHTVHFLIPSASCW